MSAVGTGGVGDFLRDLRLELRPEWMADALCQEHPDLPWFPTRGVDPAPAIAVCARCAVRAECLDFAVVEGINHGVWGGATEKEIRRKRRERGGVS